MTPSMAATLAIWACRAPGGGRGPSGGSFLTSGPLNRASASALSPAAGADQRPSLCIAEILQALTDALNCFLFILVKTSAQIHEDLQVSMGRGQRNPPTTRKRADDSSLPGGTGSRGSQV